MLVANDPRPSPSWRSRQIHVDRKATRGSVVSVCLVARLENHVHAAWHGLSERLRAPRPLYGGNIAWGDGRRRLREVLTAERPARYTVRCVRSAPNCLQPKRRCGSPSPHVRAHPDHRPGSGPRRLGLARYPADPHPGTLDRLRDGRMTEGTGLCRDGDGRERLARRQIGSSARATGRSRPIAIPCERSDTQTSSRGTSAARNESHYPIARPIRGLPAIAAVDDQGRSADAPCPGDQPVRTLPK
jgi:hypothetical protein